MVEEATRLNAKNESIGIIEYYENNFATSSFKKIKKTFRMCILLLLGFWLLHFLQIWKLN